MQTNTKLDIFLPNKSLKEWFKLKVLLLKTALLIQYQEKKNVFREVD